MIEQARLVGTHSVVASASGSYPVSIVTGKDENYYNNQYPLLNEMKFRFGMTDKIELSASTDIQRCFCGAKYLFFKKENDIVTGKLQIGWRTLEDLLPTRAKGTIYYGRDFGNTIGAYSGASLEYSNNTDWGSAFFIGAAFYPFVDLMHAVNIELGIGNEMTNEQEFFAYFGLSLDFQIF